MQVQSNLRSLTISWSALRPYGKSSWESAMRRYPREEHNSWWGSTKGWARSNWRMCPISKNCSSRTACHKSELGLNRSARQMSSSSVLHSLIMVDHKLLLHPWVLPPIKTISLIWFNSSIQTWWTQQALTSRRIEFPGVLIWWVNLLMNLKGSGVGKEHKVKLALPLTRKWASL